MTLTYIPDPPILQIARPTIKALIDGAAPQIAEPTSKRVTQRIYVHLALNCMCAETKKWTYVASAAPARKTAFRMKGFAPPSALKKPKLTDKQAATMLAWARNCRHVNVSLMS